jgi:lipoprotein LprG
MVVACLVLTGCASIEPDVQSLPAGSELVATSGNAMRSVTSAHFTVEVTGALVDVPVKSAEGDLDARGKAQGSATISESGKLAKVHFILLKGAFYLKESTGGYRKTTPASAGNLFDLTSILDPNHGMARVVIGVNDATTMDTETVNGIECYRITGTLRQNELAALLPGIGSNVGATVWLAVSGAHLPVRAEFAVPGSAGSHGDKVDMSLSNVDTPVTVIAPV